MKDDVGFATDNNIILIYDHLNLMINHENENNFSNKTKIVRLYQLSTIT